MNLSDFCRTRSARRPASAFTLTELLIAIAIIAVLAGLLLGVLGRGRENANKIACISNLHQIGLALNQYLPQNNYHLPHCAAWPGADPRIAGEETLPSIREVLMNGYLDDPLVFLCPSDEDREYFALHGLSYEWQAAAINGRKVDEKTMKLAGIKLFIMMDYDPVHGESDDSRSRNYLYPNARAVGRLDDSP